MKKGIAAIAGIMLLVSHVQAEIFRVVGARPMGMGGAYVAVADDGLAQYWNPAGLALQRGFSLTVPANASYEVTENLLRQADKIRDLKSKFDAAKTSPQSLTLSDYQAFLKALADLNDPEIGALVDANGGGGVRVGKFSVGVYFFGEAGVDPNVDTKNVNLVNAQGQQINLSGTNTADPAFDTAQRDKLAAVVGDMRTRTGITSNLSDTQAANALINEAKAGGKSDAEINQAINDAAAANTELGKAFPGTGSINDNNSDLTLRGLTRFEAAASYAHGLLGKWLLVGGSLKAQFGRVGYKKISVKDSTIDITDILRDFTANAKHSTRFTGDLGVMLNLKDTLPLLGLRAGLVAKNIVPTSFDQPDEAVKAGEGRHKLKPQIRLGLAAWPLVKWWTVASDIDLTANSTSIPGYNSRNFSFGTELNPTRILPLRAGITKNIGAKSNLAYTAGVGLNLGIFKFDIAGAISSKYIETKDDASGKVTRVPATAQVAGNLTLKF